MSDYSFSEDQKVSIWRADGEKCFYCRIPIPYSELQVDHIVPEPTTIVEMTERRSHSTELLRRLLSVCS